MEIGKELKGKELSSYLLEKLDELADNLCQDGTKASSPQPSPPKEERESSPALC